MTYPSGTGDLSDDEFVRELTSLALPNERFRHYDHIRLAWIFLRESDIGPATERMVRTLQAFGLHIRGDLSRYHDTVTRGFMRLVAAHIRMTPNIDRFDEFAAAHPMLLDKNALYEFYSPDLLDSQPARTRWVEPDLRPLP
jgi:CDP-diacylglycerol--glycerol-3-phosphate 3-phosphatidyltransferase